MLLPEIGRKKIKEVDGILLVPNVSERGGRNCLACQLPIEGLQLPGVSVGGGCSAVSLLFSADIDSEARWPVLGPVAFLVMKDVLKEVA